MLGILRHSRPDLPKLHLLHRLDRETSGVLVLAKRPEMARRWTRAMETHQIQKEYIALVRGVPALREGLIEWPIGKQGGEIKVRQWIHTPGAVPAVTRYEVVRTSDETSMVRAWPRTGRLHQIRVHFAALGHPVLGDPLYTGEGALYRKMIAGQFTETDRESLGFSRLALHAAAISFRHPATSLWLRVEAPLPDEFRTFDKLSD